MSPDPEYQHGWSSKTAYSQMRLDALGAESAAELLEALLGNDPGLPAQATPRQARQPVLPGRDGLDTGDLGRLYRLTGKREQAQEYLTTATTMYREMDMTYWLEQAEAELKQLA